MNFLILICYSDFGEIKKFDNKYISLIRLGSGLVIAFSYFLFGILIDKCKFKTLLNLITIIEIIISASLYFITINDIILIVLILLILLCIGGNLAILPPMYNKVYGISYGAEMYGIAAIWIGVAHLTGSLLSHFILKKDFDYLLAFSIGGGLCFLKIIIFNCCKIKKYNIIDKRNTINNISEIQNRTSISVVDSTF